MVSEPVLTPPIGMHASEPRSMDALSCVALGAIVGGASSLNESSVSLRDTEDCETRVNYRKRGVSRVTHHSVLLMHERDSQLMVFAADASEAKEGTLFCSGGVGEDVPQWW